MKPLEHHPSFGPRGREYAPSDYPLILEACRTGGTSLSAVCSALLEAGIRWPNLNPTPPHLPDDSADAIDRDVLRAWRELGLHPKGE